MAITEGVKVFEPVLDLQFELPEVIAEIVQSEKGEGPFSEAILLSLEESTSLLAKLITDETPVNFGHLRGAISQSKSVYYGESVFYGEVSDGGIRYAIPREYGSDPFYPKKPSREMVKSIELWIVRKQIQWYRALRSGKSVPMSPRDMAWALSWHIAKNGTEGAHMFEKGMKAAEPHIRRHWEQLMDQLVTLWGDWEAA